MKLPFVDSSGAARGDRTFAPSKIICVGRNYRAHAEELGNQPPPEPLLFFKPPSALLAPGRPIVRPSGFDRVDYEGELGVVIGRRGRNIARERALEHVAAALCVNDVTVRDLQKRDGQWTRAKGFDTFCPVGPRLVAAGAGGLDLSDVALTTRKNGEVVQSARTSLMIFSIADIIAFASAAMTLEEGDLIVTGTPAGVGPIEPGDVIEVEIEGIGVLENPVTDQTPA